MGSLVYTTGQEPLWRGSPAHGLPCRAARHGREGHTRLRWSSIKRLGLYGEIAAVIEEAGKTVVEVWGVDPTSWPWL